MSNQPNASLPFLNVFFLNYVVMSLAYVLMSIIYHILKEQEFTDYCKNSLYYWYTIQQADRMTKN